MQRNEQYRRWVEGVLVLNLIFIVMARTYRKYTNIRILPIVGGAAVAGSQERSALHNVPGSR